MRIASPATTWRWPSRTKRCTPPRIRGAIVTWRTSPAPGPIRPRPWSTPPPRPCRCARPLVASSAEDRHLATTLRGARGAKHPLGVELQHHIAARIERDHTAVSAELLHPSIEHVVDGPGERDLQVFRLRADVVRDGRADEVLAVARGRHGSAV